MMYFWTNRSEVTWSLNSMYEHVGITKQGFHDKKNRSNRYKEEEQQIIAIIRQIREDHPTMCCRSMYFKINPVYMGRDKFEALCKANGFSVIRKPNFRRTTDSSGVKRFPNLIKALELSFINQVWSSDITYFEVNGTFYYLTFILDNFSRRILGHHVSNRLLTRQTTLPALKQAIRNRKGRLPAGVIFHSDGGGQYYADEFLDLTQKYQFQNSMCEMAYENGKAERLNGVIKNNYLKHWTINNVGELTKSLDRAVKLYNEDKPHLSLQRMTPMEFENSLLTSTVN